MQDPAARSEPPRENRCLPLLQLDASLIGALHRRGFEIAVETNCTVPAPAGIDWLCVSPKGARPLVLRAGDEFKLVHRQPDAPPARFEHLGVTHFYLQPMDGPDRDENTRRAVAYCKAHPIWRLSPQTHKLIGISWLLVLACCRRDPRGVLPSLGNATYRRFPRLLAGRGSGLWVVGRAMRQARPIRVPDGAMDGRAFWYAPAGQPGRLSGGTRPCGPARAR